MIETNPMMHEGALKDKTVLITGGGSGLGKAMAKRFLLLGATLIITSRNLEKLELAKKELESATNGKVFVFSCDVRDYESVENMLDQAIEAAGKIDVLLNNAAGNFISPTERLSPNAFNTVVDIVLKGTSNCTLALGKRWIANKEQNKSILNIVTTYAWTGSAYVVPSAAAKAGVLALTRSLAVEWAKYGIRSNAIAPGVFPTKGAMERLLPPELQHLTDMSKKIPLGRVGKHEELGNLASYVISDYASFLNGEVITLDGGEWLQGAGQFNMLQQIPKEMWDALEQMRKK
ncbi:MAG TPA: SDR family oxidoreductase [Flavobacteriaceae bacterium]|nr:SDR family oxidoreductase [Flavobacteriaceae bacterium]